MKRQSTQSVSRYALIVWLSVTLLFVQTFNPHMHIGHGENSSPATVEHMADIHIHTASFLHGIYDNLHYQGNFQNHHHMEEITVSPDGLVKKTGSLNPLVFLIFIVTLVLYVPRLRRIRRIFDSKTERPPRYYLVHPPSRAPPL